MSNLIDLNNENKTPIPIHENDLEIYKKIKQFSQVVYNSIGSGLSEAIYHNGLECELRNNNIKYDTEFPIPIKHLDRTVGFCRGDILIDTVNIGINKKYILELKAIRSLKQEHISQLKAYLRHMNLDIGFLVNFPYPEGTESEILIVHKKHGNIT